MKLTLLVLFGLTMACSVPFVPQPPQEKVGLILVPVPVSQASVCWPWKDGGMVCQGLNTFPGTNAFMVRGMK
jgi:hypothetical protein